MTVRPTSATLEHGESISYELAVPSNSSVAPCQRTFGSLTWSRGPHAVRSPIALDLVAPGASDEVAGTGTEGALSFNVSLGCDGDYSTAAHGPEPATMRSGKDGLTGLTLISVETD